MDLDTESAETILREEWDGAEAVGGFFNETIRQHVRSIFEGEFCDPAILDLKLIGFTWWSDIDHEHWSQQWLFLNQNDQSFWFFENGLDQDRGRIGLDFANEVRPIEMVEWLTWVETRDRSFRPLLSASELTERKAMLWYL